LATTPLSNASAGKYARSLARAAYTSGQSESTATARALEGEALAAAAAYGLDGYAPGVTD
jgi:hypothetical protein